MNIDDAAKQKSDQEANKQKEMKVDKGTVQSNAKVAQGSNASKASVPFETKETATTERNNIISGITNFRTEKVRI